VIAGLRFLTTSAKKFTTDPSIALWLFIVLTQVQIMLALLSASSPALKQALIDFGTQYGMTTDSRSVSKHHGSYPLKSLDDVDRGNLKFETSRKRLLSNARSSRSRIEAGGLGDGDSQTGIIRQDDYDVTYTSGDSVR
jgi:hypothetical protein